MAPVSSAERDGGGEGEGRDFEVEQQVGGAVAIHFERFAAGETQDQILQAHPRLTVEAIRAAIGFAAAALRADVVYPTAESTR